MSNSKNKTELDNMEEQVNGCTSIEQIDVKLNCDTGSNGTDSQVCEPLEEHVREFLNILIEPVVDCDKKKPALQGKERKQALFKMRKRKHDEEVSYANFHKYKTKFEELLNKKKITDDDKKTKTYDELCKMLITPKSLYEERAAFYQAQMSHDESLDEYFERLTDLSSSCQFGERQSLVIADKFILSQSNIHYAFCGEDQKEVRGKKALKIAKKNYDKKVFS